MIKVPPAILTLAGIVALLGLIGTIGVIAFIGKAWFGVPFGDTGPDQPIDFPHTVHAGSVSDGGLELDCTFCHRNVDKGAAATIPSVQQCMFCHSHVSGSTEKAIAEIGKFRGLDSDGKALATPMKSLEPISWERVHRLPDHVQFVHDVHVNYLMTNPNKIVNTESLIISADGTVSASATCSTCHGEVQKMIKVKQVRSLKMGDCVDCHRQNDAPTDCAICHY